VVVTTSGYPVTEAVAKKIAAAGLSMLNISLESLRPEIHDGLRGVQGVHKRAMQALELVSAYAPDTELAINTIIVNDNADELPDLAAWANEDPRLSQIYFMAVMRPFGSDLALHWFDTDRARDLWPVPYERVSRSLERLKEMKTAGVRIGNTRTHLGVFQAYFRDPANFIKRQACTVGTQALNVNAIGDVYLCFFMEKIGSVREMEPYDMWYSPAAEKIRERIRACRKNCELVVNCYYEDEA